MIRIGVDFGGTKIEAAALDASGVIRARVRAPNPGSYEAALGTVRDLVARAEAEAGETVVCVGVGMPGSISPRDGLIRNANSTWLNGRRFGEDLQQTLAREVRLENDANCMALSEATDGAAAGARTVFAAIIGTGCGGGLVVDGRILDGANGIAGEWGHSPLPWPEPDEYPGHACWCGRRACLETYISGTGFVRDYEAATGRRLTGAEIEAAAEAGEPEAQAALDRYVDRLGRALAVVSDIFDPEVIVLAGGMSNTQALYDGRLPQAVARHVFSDVYRTPIVQAKHGDSSGVRGAAWLWPIE
jgi:fructokinase